jgi:hypothetical protein
MKYKPSFRTKSILMFLIFAGAATLFSQACGGFKARGVLGENLNLNLQVPDVVGKTCGASYSAGHVSIHRLTNSEYNNTIRDLLYSNSKPADSHNFPISGVGASGFSNDSDNLKVFGDLTTKYYEAAEAMAAEVIGSKGMANGSYERIAPCGSAVNAGSMLSCSTSTVRTFGARAFRRPLTDVETTKFMSVFNKSGDFDTGLNDVIISFLMNPKFIFVSLTDAKSLDPSAQYALNDYALASRLSYFLWQSMPDDELFNLAKANKLNDATNLKKQVDRMLADPKASVIATMLTNDWAGLDSLRTAFLPGVTDQVRDAMVQETELFFQDLVSNKRSFLNVLTGRYSYVNKALADFYGMNFPAGTEVNTFVRVEAPQTDRTGVVTQASVLTVTAGDTAATHPVKRGKWVTSKILCSEPPPPPQDVNTAPNPNATGTVRQKLEAHASNPKCSGCHQTMDPIGLALENYDPFGKWRTIYPDTKDPIDAAGSLPTGESFTNAKELYARLGNSETVKGCLARQVMNLAVTRAMTSADDKCVANSLGLASVNEASTFNDLVYGVVSSLQFRMQKGEAP